MPHRCPPGDREKTAMDNPDDGLFTHSLHVETWGGTHVRQALKQVRYEAKLLEGIRTP